MRKNKIHSRRRNIITLAILLLIFFLFDNILLSLTKYIPTRLEEYREARTLDVTVTLLAQDEETLIEIMGDADAGRKDLAWLEDYLQSAPGVVSYVRNICSFSATVDETGEKYSIDPCDYNAIKEYILTEDCGEPEGNQVLVPKYIEDRDIGSYLLSFAELDVEVTDGEALVGKTIPVTVTYFPEYREDSMTLEKELTVIGVYDNYAMVDDAHILINPDTMEAWREEAEATIDYVPGYGIPPQDYVSITVSCESRAALLELKEYLKNAAPQGEWSGFACLDKSMIDESYITMFSAILAVGNFILLLFLINLAINIVYTEENQVYLRRREYGLLKATGYRNGRIELLHLRETAVNVLIVLAVTFGLGTLILFTLNLLLSPMLNLLFETLRLKVYFSVCILCVAIVLLSMGIGCGKGLRMISRMEAIDALKNEE